jgi:hypothetical protein
VDTTDATAALVRFQERLEQAQAAGQVDPSHLPGGSTPWRWQQGLWIKAAQHLMEDLSLGRFLGLPLGMLEALGDLDRGKARDGRLAPASMDGTPHLGLATVRTQARAIKVIHLMLMQPKAQRPSAKAAARRVWQTREDWTGIFDNPDQMVELRRNAQRGHANADILRLWEMPLSPAEFGSTITEQVDGLLALISER